MKRVIFIGQAMPRYKEELHDWKSLNKWLYSIGLTDEKIRRYFYYSALVDYFPGNRNGSHLVPNRQQIEKETERLTKTILEFAPEIVVPVGRLSISYCLQTSIASLKDVIGRAYFADPYLLTKRQIKIIPLPHPSGASTWKHKPENQKLLLKALHLLKAELG